MFAYSSILSYYAFGVLLTGTIASLYSPRIGSAMKLIALLGLLNFNISATHFASSELPRILPISQDFLRLLRILLLCWLTWAILSFGIDLLQVRWRRLRHLTAGYCAIFSAIYLAGFFFWSGTGQIWLEIVIYLVLALYSLGIPIICLNLGIRNTLGQHPVRHWYKEITSTMLFCALLQVFAFIPLYLSYFPNILNLKDYAEANLSSGDGLASQISQNFFSMYFFFFSLPFLSHCLYSLWRTRIESRSTRPQLFGPNLEHLPELGDLLGEKSTEHLQAFTTSYEVSKREAEVLQKLILGNSYAAIAEQLFISLPTVKSHVYSIYRKTGVKNKIQLLAKILNA